MQFLETKQRKKSNMYLTSRKPFRYRGGSKEKGCSIGWYRGTSPLGHLFSRDPNFDSKKCSKEATF